MPLDLFQPGIYCRAPGGNLEHPELHRLAVKWVAWNANPGEGQPELWDKAKGLWAQAGIPYFPWLHCHTYDDIKRLIQLGLNEQAPAIGMNIEDVVTDQLNLQAVADLLKLWPRPVHMATLAWVQNGQGWGALNACVAALEIFKGDYPDADHPQACIEHALNEGLTRLTVMLGTKNHVSKDYADCGSVCRSLYTADDIPLTTAAWADWAAPTPCTRPAKPVPPPPPGGNVPLTPTAKKKFRDELVAYTLLAEQYDERWHYSQRRPYTGLGAAPQTYHYNDCSSYCALAFYWAGRHTGHPVSDPLGWNYSGYGNTQSALGYLRGHAAPPGRYLVGDMAIYGTTSRTVHMVICRKGGNEQTAVWSSFGREAGPEARSPVDYHPAPLVGVYRHPALQ